MDATVTANRNFLNFFWDLASDDTAKRIAAGDNIIAHTFDKGVSAVAVDKDYVCNRLIKGLSSSRESARLGFAGCLAALLSKDYAVNGINGSVFSLAHVLESLASATQVNGSLKGADERELMFGKLFGCLALVRSGRLQGDASASAVVFKHLSELYLSKIWMREAAVEALLHLLASLSLSSDSASKELIRTAFAPKLWIMLTQQAHTIGSATLNSLNSLSDDASVNWFSDESNLQSLSPAQLSLLCGLQTLQLPALSAFIPSIPVVYSAPFDCFAETLLAATAGFPKINRVWDWLLGAIFGLDANFALVNSRCSTLSVAQSNLLKQLIQFMNTQLMQQSHEKKSVCYHLFVHILRRIPESAVALFHMNIILKNLYLAKVNGKHTLNELSAKTLKATLSCVSDSVPMKLVLANALVAVGGINFDSRTNMKIVQSLLSELDNANMCKFVDTIVSQFINPTNSIDEDQLKKMIEQQQQSTEDEDNNENEQQTIAQLKQNQIETNRISSLECLFALAKNLSLHSARSYVLPVTVALLCVCGYVDLTQLYQQNSECNSKIITQLIDVLSSWKEAVAEPTAASTAKKGKRKGSVDLTEQQLQQIEFRSTMKKAIESILLSISPIATASAVAPSAPQSAKKGKKSASKQQTEEPQQTQQQHQFTALTNGVTRFAQRKLLGLFADCSNAAQQQQQQKGGNKDNKTAVAAVPVVPVVDRFVLDESLSLMHCLLSNNVQLLKHASNSEDEEQDEEEAVAASEVDASAMTSEVYQCVRQLQELLTTKQQQQSTGAATGAALSAKCIAALKQLLITCAFHVFVNGATQASAMQQMVKAVTALLAGERTMLVPRAADDDEEEVEAEVEAEEEEESVQCVLLDAVIDVLSCIQTNDPGAVTVAADTSAAAAAAQVHSKGIRDCVRAAFACLAAEQPDAACIFAAVEAVAQGCDEAEGEDNADEEDQDEFEGAVGGEAEGDTSRKERKQKDIMINADQLMTLLTGEEDEIAEEEEQEGSAAAEEQQHSEAKTDRKRKATAAAGASNSSSQQPANKKKQQQQAESESEGESDNNEAEEEEEEEQEIDEEEWARQDRALSKMLSLKQASRKTGITEAMRIQTNNRSRVLDILEVYVHSFGNNSNSSNANGNANDQLGHAMTYCIRKLNLCLKFVCTNKLVQASAEGVSFANRLLNYIVNKLCTKKYKSFTNVLGDRKVGEEGEAEGEEENSFEGELEEYQQTMSLVVSLCKHQLPTIRDSAAACFAALVKASLWLLTHQQQQQSTAAIDADRLEQVLSTVFMPLLEMINELIDKKHTRLNINLVANLLTRFPHILLLNSHVLHALLRGATAARSVFMQLHCVTSSVTAIRNLCTHGGLLGNNNSNNNSANSSSAISLQDLCSNVTSAIHTLLHHITSICSALKGSASAESLKRRVSDFILAGKDVLLIVKSIAKASKVEGLQANWEAMAAEVKAFVAMLQFVQSSDSVSSTVQNKAKNVLNDICREVESLVSEKSAKQSKAAPAVEDKQQQKQQKKRKSAVDEGNGNSLIDQLERKYQSQQSEEATTTTDNKKKTKKESNNNKSASTEMTVEEAEAEPDRSAIASSGRWFTAETTPTPAATGADKKKQKKAKA